jgi:hypothetical protein
MGAFDTHKNLAYSTIASAPSPAASGTSLDVAAGEGARFPAVPFNATVWPANQIATPANAEIVRVTAIATDTLTIARAQETGAGGPSARTILVGDQIAATITAKTLTDVENAAQWVEQTTSNTGTQNNFDLNGPHTVLRCTGAAPVFTGFTVNGAAPYAGCMVLIECLGTTAKVAHQDTNSTAANRVIAPSTAGQIVGANGTMLCVYDDTTDRWREYLIAYGTPIDVAFSAGNFTANGSMTWTVAAGDQAAFSYFQDGNILTINISIATSTVGGTPNTDLIVALPGGFTVATALLGLLRVVDNGTAQLGFWFASAAATSVLFRATLASANWSVSTDATYLSALFTIQVQ